jgi:hypothetical protein
VIYQRSRRQGERVELAERMALQEFQMSLLTALPLRDALEVIDVPADEFGECRCALLDANERRGVFQRDFPMFCPGEGGRTVREGPVFLMDDRRALADPNHRRIARCAVRLFPSSYRCHGDL